MFAHLPPPSTRQPPTPPSNPLTLSLLFFITTGRYRQSPCATVCTTGKRSQIDLEIAPSTARYENDHDDKEIPAG